MKTECLIGQSQPLLSKLPNRAHVFVFLFLLATHTWRKIHCQGRPFKQHLGRDLKSLQFASKCTFPAVCSFLYYHEMGLLQGLNNYIYKWKIPSQLFSTFWNRFPFLRPTKMFTSGKSGSFLTLNSVWEKFLSPMIIWQCARFRNQPSFQSGALTGWRPYCALYLDIYVVGPVQPEGSVPLWRAGLQEGRFLAGLLQVGGLHWRTQ